MTRSGATRESSRHAFGVGWIVGQLAAYLDATGFDSKAIRALPDLRNRNLEDPDALFPAPALGEAWRLAVSVTRDDALGLHLAERMPQGSLDLVEYSFRASDTLASALERLARYGRLLNDRLAMRVLVGSRDLRFLAAEADGRPLDRQRAELSLGLVLRLARETTLVEIAPVEVSFAHPAPEDVSEHRRFFRSAPRFSAGVSELVFSRADADRPLHSADDALAGVVRRRLDKLLAQREGRPAGSTAARVRQLLVGELGQGEVSAARAARGLGLSTRTLTRRLAAEATSFRAILDGLRAETALALLRDPALGIAEVAFFLGYSEPAAFHRSFRRWTGQTPLAYRRGEPGARNASGGD